MRKILLAVVLATGTLAATTIVATTAVAKPQGADGDTVRTWSSLALDSVRAKGANDAAAARVYAMVHVATYDAVNGLAKKDDRRSPALVAPDKDAGGNPVAAAAGAAHDVLVGLYPDRAGIYDTQLAADLAGVNAGGQASKGRQWGARVAAAVLAARETDGSSPVEPTLPPGEGIGVYRGTFSNPQYRNLEPFAIDNSGEYVGDGPPALESLDYAAAFNEVKVLGNADLEDAEKDGIFRFWALSGGTGQPAGAWLQVAQAVSAAQGLSLADTARLFALQTMAMADTVAPTYETKFEFRFWRPVTAIAEAAGDGNDETQPADWTSRGGAGTSPEYWSGHSSFSAAGARVLQGFFCSDSIPFSLTSDSTGVTRSYDSFSTAAAEAGRSRIYGGLHFEFSNQEGLTAGREVAAEVLSDELLLQRGATHLGDCPL